MQSCSTVELRRLMAVRLKGWQDFEEVPVSIQVFIDSPEYLGIKNDIRPVVRQDLIDLFSGPYNEAVFVEAIGAGKSWKSGAAIAYMTYYASCLKDPQKSLGLAPGSKIAFMNMATSGKQAKDIVFGKIKAFIDRSPWFQTYAPPDPRITSRLCFPKNIYILAGSSSEKAPLGYDILGGVMDEAAFYHQPGVTAGRHAKDQAAEIHTALSRRIFSRFGHLPRKLTVMMLLIMISSPRYEDDFIETKYEEARTDPKIFARRRALWDAMPPGTYSKRTFYDEELKQHIPVNFAPEWKKNPHKARRDFAARPSAALNPFMDAMVIEKIMAKSQLVEPITVEDEYGWPVEWAEWFRGQAGTRYAMHIDLAKSRDACGVAMGHWDRGRSKAVLDFALQIRTSEKKHLNFQRVREIVFLMRAYGFHLFAVTYDNFQSVDSIQLLQSKGIPAEHLSVDRGTDAYDTFLGLVNQDQFDTYENEILLRECKRLELVDGKKVDHPPNGSKDVADAVAGVCFHLGTVSGTGRPTQVVVANKAATGMAGVGRRSRV